jgi:hypothetical protein
MAAAAAQDGQQSPYLGAAWIGSGGPFSSSGADHRRPPPALNGSGGSSTRYFANSHCMTRVPTNSAVSPVVHLLRGAGLGVSLMVWRARERDPRSDPAAADVMAAYQAATQAGLPTPRCYRAGVEAWRRAHPDHTAVYAGKQAVAVILGAKEEFLLHVG